MTARSATASFLSSAYNILAVISISAVSFGAGWFLASSPSISDNNNDDHPKSEQPEQEQQYYCECGFDLTGKSAYHQAQHRAGRLHRVNLYRGSKAPILVTAKVNEYRAAIATHIKPTDIVMEIGCAEGLTTQRLAQRAKVAIGIDQNQTLIQKGQTRVFQQQQQQQHDDDHTDNNNNIIINNNNNNNNSNATTKTANHNDKVNDDNNDQHEYSWSNLFLHTADAFNKSDLIKIVDDVLTKTNCVVNELEESEQDPKEGNEAINSSAPSSSDTETTKPMSKREKRDLRDSQWWGKHGRNKHAGKVTKIWIDISGSRELRTVVFLIDILESLFQPELIVVKSDNLKNLIRRTYLPSAHIPGLTAEAPRSKDYIIR